MPTYEIVIRATVTKTYVVEADTEDVACEQAHEIFNILNDDVPEDYNQETLSIERMG
jgi:hypothetical protein